MIPPSTSNPVKDFNTEGTELPLLLFSVASVISLERDVNR